MNLAHIVIAALCIMWVLVCGMRWWITDPRNKGQRHFFAIAAGLGAGLFWIIGNMVWDALSAPQATRQDAPVIESGSEIRIKGR